MGNTSAKQSLKQGVQVKNPISQGLDCVVYLVQSVSHPIPIVLADLNLDLTLRTFPRNFDLRYFQISILILFARPLELVNELHLDWTVGIRCYFLDYSFLIF